MFLARGGAVRRLGRPSPPLLQGGTGGGSEPRERAGLTKPTSQQLPEQSLEPSAPKLSCPHQAEPPRISWVLWNPGNFQDWLMWWIWWLGAQDMAAEESSEGDPRRCSGPWAQHAVPFGTIRVRAPSGNLSGLVGTNASPGTMGGMTTIQTASRTHRYARPRRRWTRGPSRHHCSCLLSSCTPSPGNRSVCSVGLTPLLGCRCENVTQAWPIRTLSSPLPRTP